MPELPEVETICRGIRPHVVGRSFLHLRHSGKDLRQPVPIERIESLILGHTVTAVRRRAKYLLVETDAGSLLIIHLGMTGNLGIFSPKIPPVKHCHLQLAMSDGMELRYTDVRRFGSIHILTSNEAETAEETFFASTGPEPFSDAFNADYLYRLSRNRSIPAKTFIMTNQVVAGVGNIYANESFFKAGIDPRKNANHLSRKSWQKLLTCIQNVLNHAIDCGGSTISDYVNADQQSGYFQINFQVYGREGEKCLTCDTPIKKTKLNGRACYYCPSCQK